MNTIERPPTLTDIVTAHFREAIVRGDYAPGTSLHEVDLSKALDVSRGTIREALRKLQDEGLVRIFPHRGAEVIELSPRRIHEIYTLRTQLEPFALRLAVQNKAFTAQDFEQLEALVDRLGELEQQGNIFEILKTDMETHYLMCERSGHELLLDMLKTLQTQVRQFILTTKVYRSDLVSDEVSHRAILDAIKTGDPFRAEQVMHEHISQAGQSLLESMKKIGQ